MIRHHYAKSESGLYAFVEQTNHPLIGDIDFWYWLNPEYVGGYNTVAVWKIKCK